jgi:hypothetical protein
MTEGLGLPIISVPDIKFVAGNPGTDIRAHLAELATDLQAAMAHHQAGGLDEAEALYRKLLDAVPNHPHALRCQWSVSSKSSTRGWSMIAKL